MASYTPELEEKLNEIQEHLSEDRTVLVILDDMYEINERFQAVMDWLKTRGRKLKQRYNNGIFFDKGVLYFVGADTYNGDTRGVNATYDFRPFASQLVRERGLAARLREKGMA